MKDLFLYCNCFAQNENLLEQFNQKNLMGAAYKLSKEYRNELSNKNFLFDDTLDNISNLNDWFGDLTGLYWVWKNTNHEYVGTNQYRRFWNNEEILQLNENKNSLYISAPVSTYTSIEEQFINFHGKIGIDIIKYVAELGKINMPYLNIDLKNINVISPCNMFFAHKNVFDKTCEILFEILFEIYSGIKYTIPFIVSSTNYTSNPTRLLAFLSERILTMIYKNSNYYFDNVEIIPISWMWKEKIK